MDTQKLKSLGIVREKETDFFRFTEEFTLPLSIEADYAGARSKDKNLPLEIFPLIQAMTANKVTRNSTFYSETELQYCLETWVKPYPRPILLNHLDGPGFFGGEISEPLGRVIAAKYIPPQNSYPGYLALVPHITDPTCIEKVLDGRYHTVSIGMAASDVVCSICGCRMSSDAWCDHVKGEPYPNEDGRNVICYYMPLGLVARELSFVNVPSDDEAHVKTPDLGRKQAVLWAGSPGAVTAFGESAQSHTTTLLEALKGYTFSESFKKENEMSTTQENQTPEEIKLSTMEEIASAAKALVESAQKGETVQPELLKQVQEAISKAGISKTNLVRVVTSPTEGVPALSSELLSYYSKVAELTSQKEMTPKEFVEFMTSVIEDYNTYIESLKSESVTKVDELTESNTKLETLETEKNELVEKLKEWESKAEAVLSNEVNSLKESLELEKTKSKNLLSKTVALEMLRQEDPSTKGKTIDEIIEKLAKRSEESLNDRLSDLLEAYGDTTTPPAKIQDLSTIETVINPAASNRKEEKTDSGIATSLENIMELMKKFQVTAPVEETTTPVITPVEEAAVQDTETEQLVMFFNQGKDGKPSGVATLMTREAAEKKKVEQGKSLLEELELDSTTE